MMYLNTIFTAFFFGLLTVVISQAACPKTDGTTTIEAAFENVIECIVNKTEFIDNNGEECLVEHLSEIRGCTAMISLPQKQLSALTTEDCKALSTAETCLLGEIKKCTNGKIIADVWSASFKNVLKESPCSSSSKDIPKETPRHSSSKDIPKETTRSSSSRPATFGLGILLTMAIMVFSQ